jgi:CRISPR-associated endoribonuclease Cas6
MIQLSLEFQLEKPQLPLEYERLMVSFLKAASRNYSEDMFERLYNKEHSIIKSFTFSTYLPGAVFKGDTIFLRDNRFKVFFTDADMGQTIEWFNAFQLMRYKQYPVSGNSMKLISIRSNNRKDIVDDEIIVKMQSPLIVRRHDSVTNKDIYYTYADEGFSKALCENVEIFIQKMEIGVDAEGLSIEPVKARKVVVNCFGRKVDANLGIYKLRGNCELLNILYQAGMGARRSEGHGKFEILL